LANDFIPFAVGGSANVTAQATYAANTTLTQNGFQAGIAKSPDLNKVWRQSSIMAAVLAQFIVDQSGQNAVDDGTTATLEANLIAAIRNASKQTVILTDTGAANAYTAVNAPALTVLPSTGYVQRINIAHANTGASTYAPDGLTAKPIYGLGLQPLQGGELPVGVAVLMYLVQAGVNSGNGAWIIIDSLGGAQQIAPATASQHAVQLGQIGGGQYLGTQIFTSSGTYTPGVYTVGGRSVTASKARFRGVAAGGAGGGTAATSAGQAASGGGGAAGNPFEFTLSPAATQTITIGAAGTGVAGSSGGSGGNLVIGAIATIKGGAGGAVGGVLGSFPGNSGQGGLPSASTISGTGVTVIYNGYGQGGNVGSCFSISFTINGPGGSSPYGSSGVFGQPGALGFGSGGLGAGVGQSTAAAAGSPAAPGILFIDEYA
jgi:hypothetical protein